MTMTIENLPALPKTFCRKYRYYFYFYCPFYLLHLNVIQLKTSNLNGY